MVAGFDRAVHVVGVGVRGHLELARAQRGPCQALLVGQEARPRLHQPVLSRKLLHPLEIAPALGEKSVARVRLPVLLA